MILTQKNWTNSYITYILPSLNHEETENLKGNETETTI
jgi:hypothetical protein